MYTKTTHYNSDGSFAGISVTQEDGQTDHYDENFDWVGSSEAEQSE